MSDKKAKTIFKEVSKEEFYEFCANYQDNKLSANMYNTDIFYYDDEDECVAMIEDNYIDNKYLYYIKDLNDSLINGNIKE